MPTQVDSTTAQINHSAINQTWIIAPGVNAGGGVASSFTGSGVVNYGNILSSDFEGVFLVSESFVLNMPGALITGVSGVNTNSDLLELRNEGTIVGFQDHGVRAGGAANHITINNSGSISGRLSGVVVDAGSALVVSITNSGTISSDEQGVWLLNATGAQPVVVNSGTIRGLFNSILAEAGDRLNVTNTGSLIGNVRGSSLNQSDSVTNNGTIAGNVLLGSGMDIYSGSGTVSGTIFGEAGNDSLSGGAGADRLDGGADNDVLTGGAGNDVLTGGLGADTMFGGAGNDTYSVDNPGDIVNETGGNGIDLVQSSITFSLANAARAIGAVENLTLFNVATALNGLGNGLANVITGNNFNNTLNGMAGNDTLLGGAGNDILIGGLGRDIHTGGANNDIFRFQAANHSTVGANADVITDFDDSGDDRIDLSALAGPVMTYIGAAAFTGVRQVRINDIAGADLLVEVNTGGSLAADFAIRLTGTALGSMAGSDFVL